MSVQRETAKFHTVALTLIRKPGLSERRIYVLYTLSENAGAPVAFRQLAEYFLEHGRTRSPSWQRDVARAVGLLLDFLKANEAIFQGLAERPQVLALFAEALVGGTINLSGDDPSGLYWEPRSHSRATALLNAVTMFSDWLVNRYDTTPINPWRSASVSEQMAYWRRFDKRRTHALLAHTYGKDEATAWAKLARSVSIRRKSISSHKAEIKHFPEDKIWDLLKDGFVQQGKAKARSVHERISIRDALITILMHGGGLRESEPFHLYVSDVFVDPKNPKGAQVRLYHPEHGKAPDDYIDPVAGKYIDGDREEYLRVKWKTEPRNLSAGRLHAGWKDLKLTNGRDKYALVHWFPAYWGEVFLSFFKIYITQLRSRHCNHPFLFISHKDSVAGDPYTVDAFRQAHGKAVSRIGLTPGKLHGTTPHGHRHAYAQHLTDAGLPEQIIQAALHHKSPESQQVYKEPPADKVNRALREASEKMSGDIPKVWIGEAGK